MLVFTVRVTTTHAEPFTQPTTPAAYMSLALAHQKSDRDFLAAVDPRLAVEHDTYSRELAVLTGFLSGVAAQAQRPTEASQRGVRYQMAKAGMRGGR